MFTGKTSARQRKRWAIVAAIAALSVFLTLLLGNVRFFQLVHLKASDMHFLVRGNLPTPDIVVIAVDRKSLETFPELMMFWHPYYADAIKAAAAGGAKVLGLDLTFVVPVEKWEPGHDSLLAEAVSSTAGTMPVVCAFIPAMMAKQREWVAPINVIASAFNQSGYANLTADQDDFVRNQALIEEPNEQGEFTRGLAFRVAEKYRGVDAKIENGKLVWNGRVIPATAERTIAINFAGPPNTFEFISLSDFVQAARAGRTDQIRKWVGGKAVFLGPDSEVDDRHPTPYYTAFSGQKYRTAGVEIHANTLRTLLNDDYLVPVTGPVRFGAIAIVALLTAYFAASLAPVRTAATVIGCILATAVATQVLFRFGRTISTSELLLACLISLLSSMAYRFLTAEKRGAFFQNAISVFVGKQFAADISEQQKISLSGKRQMLTILFSDIRGFTAFCESKDPAVVVDLLNEYMGAMVAIIVKHHGSVNKFIGDGILAIFSDNDDGAKPGDHALRAVRCGTEMAQYEGKFKTGVGIHSGPAIVGNVGSKDKMEYTVLGDTVNLASRLESMNKEMKTHLILSDATKELLDGQFETTYLAEVPVRGKTAPLVVHTATALVAPKQEMAEKT